MWNRRKVHEIHFKIAGNCFQMFALLIAGISGKDNEPGAMFIALICLIIGNWLRKEV